ncbi:hypothetical protein C5167_025280 [Papaver somniferum]|uniref:Uncharacterized protein n=1 Tax=Papaver somniferum TaxID=3469 RepID=A0A4Y7JS28_PAPSO|nr:uncharacterized protein LOC113280395 [Papaver somniferum]RZC63527.1 hypothetical protein C5167_025280 [Papaver somniferum]
MVATVIISLLQNIWPFKKPNKPEDLRISDELVNKLAIPDQTKQFVFAIKDPKSESVIYILAAQNLSQQSGLDAEILIKEVKPDAVIAQVSYTALTVIREEEKNYNVPTSSFGVIKGCFLNKINKERYDSLAENQVLKEIFGIGFNGHFLSAEKAAKEVGSLIYVLYDNEPAGDPNPYLPSWLFKGPVMSMNVKEMFGSMISGGSSDVNSQPLGSSSLVPHKMGSLCALSGSKRLCLTNDFYSNMVKSVVSRSVSNLSIGSEAKLGDARPKCDYQAPSYAQTLYPLLTDLYDIFDDLPSIGRAFAYAQKMLYNVEKGETVETQILSEVLAFRVAIEGMRLGLNTGGRCASNQMMNQISSENGYSELSSEDKLHALFAKALQSQTEKFKSVVAIVDASTLGGLRKHWNTILPPEVDDAIEYFFTEHEENSASENTEKKGLLSKKPVVAVGAGATAVLGASSLSKLLPVSPLLKLAAYKTAAMKFTIAQTQKALSIAFSKSLTASKLVFHGIGSSGAKTSVMKAAVSAEKVRTVAHSVITYAEKTSFSTMRTVFYEIMRKRRIRPVGFVPWATFGCSIGACAGLLVYGDGIECAVESVPVATRIASLGRGVQNLHEASQVVANNTEIREAVQSLLYGSKTVKVKVKES